MMRLMGIVSILVLAAIQLFVGLVFSDYLVEHGLSPKETSLVSVVAVSCYLLGILVTMGNVKFSKKKPEKTP